MKIQMTKTQICTVSLLSLYSEDEHLLHRRLLTFSCHLIDTDMFYMGVPKNSDGDASVFSADSGIGVSLMKTDRKRKSLYSASETLLRTRRMDRIGTFGS